MDAGLSWNQHAEAYYQVNQAWCEKDEDFAESTSSDYLVLGSFGEQQLLEQFAAEVSTRFAGKYTTIVVPQVSNSSELYYCELTLTQVSKWSGLMALAQSLDVDQSGICAVGDELNDLPMIKQAAVGVAMGNASPELQAQADWVCGHNQEDGLLDVVRYIQERNGVS